MTYIIDQIYAIFHQRPESHILKVEQAENFLIFSCSDYIKPEEVATSWFLFKRAFGDFPHEKICDQNPRPLTKTYVRHFLVNLAVFQANGPPLKFLSFEQFTQIFLDKVPCHARFLIDRAGSSGKGFEGFCEKVYLQWVHFFAVKSEMDPIKISIREAEFLTSRMADREFQEGEYCYLQPNSVFVVDKVVALKGAYITLLKNVSDSSKLKIVCRGTALRLNAKEGLNSVLNDLHFEIGNGGVQACWPTIFRYLMDNQIREVELLGRSLGGAHAQRLAILIMKLPTCVITHLTTVCSVGVGVEADLLFKALIAKDDRYKQLKITVIRNGGDASSKDADYTPCVGGNHLGADINSNELDLNLYYIHPTSHQITSPNHRLSIIQNAVQLTRALNQAHLRQVTLNDFNYRQVKDRLLIQQELKFGESFERARRWIAWRNRISFSHFVHPDLYPKNYRSIAKIISSLSCFFFILFTYGIISYLQGSESGDSKYILPLMIAGNGLSVISLLTSSCYSRLSAKLKREFHKPDLEK